MRCPGNSDFWPVHFWTKLEDEAQPGDAEFGTLSRKGVGHWDKGGMGKFLGGSKA